MESSSGEDSNLNLDSTGHYRRAWHTLRWREWFFVIVSVLGLGTVAGLTVQRMAEFYHKSINYTEYSVTVPINSSHGSTLYVLKSDLVLVELTFASVLLFNTAFSLFYIFSGLLRERLFEIYLFLFSVSMVIFYCVIEFVINDKKRSNLKIIRLFVAVIFGPLITIFALSILRSFGWLEFRIVGPSRTLQNAFRRRSLFFSLLACDLQVALTCIILSTRRLEPRLLNSKSDDAYYSLTIIISLAAGIPYSIIYACIASVAIKKEIRSLCYFVFLCGLALPVYTIYVIISSAVNRHIHFEIFEALTKVGYPQYLLLIVAYYSCAVILVIIRISSMWCMRIVSKHFGKGLKQKVFHIEKFEYKKHKVKDLMCC